MSLRMLLISFLFLQPKKSLRM
uniref:Uncharacterized protein n=1 Tax=Rhizophora mucronata TaxID=61149 RepID=A0A2P2PWE1_RHIMU